MHKTTRNVYLGKDEQFANQVRRELDMLRSLRRSKKQLAYAVRAGRRSLREIKGRLVPVLAELGIHYHGDELRTRRRSRESMTTKTSLGKKGAPDHADAGREGRMREGTLLWSCRSDGGKREGMVARPNNPTAKGRELQRQLYIAAKRNRERRFHALYDRTWRSHVPSEA